MATSITYGSYSFPTPIPLFSEEDTSIKFEGELDHSAIRVNLVGYLTGADLSSLDSQKMQMINGFLNEYEDLTITVENESKVCPSAFVESIEFGESDLTSFLPYSLTALYYSGESFSEYFRVTEPQNSWSYSENKNKVVSATHSVSAKGIKVDSTSAFDNARSFVNSKLTNGYEDVSLFNSSSNGFLKSRTENIDKKNNVYGVTEIYDYSTSDRPISDSGVVSLSTSISYNVDQELSVSVQGSVQGSIDSNTGSQVGLLTTGNFTPAQATDVAINALVNSYSDYETGVYEFVSDGPSSFNYDLETGANLLNFSFNFSNPENVDLINGNVVHKHSVSIGLTKDSSLANVSVNGSLAYQGISVISNTGVYEEGPVFLAVTGAFETIDPYNIARTALEDFVDIATGYKFNSSYLDSTPKNFSITKDPIEKTLNYSYNYSNNVDLSQGQLNNLSLSIKDTVPIQLNSVQETISGVQASLVASRKIGQYSVSSSCSNQGDDLDTLKTIVSGYCSGSDIISESFSTGQNSISYNLSKYY